MIVHPQQKLARLERQIRQIADSAERAKRFSEFYKVNDHDYLDWIARHLRIVNREGRLVPYQINATNRKFFEEVRRQMKAGRPVRIIMLAPRRSFKSSGPAALGFLMACMRDNYEVRIVAHLKDAAREIFRYVRRFLEEIPEPYRRRIVAQSSERIEFDNHSAITVWSAENVRVGRGLQTHFLHIAEVAYIRQQEDALRGLIRTVPDAPDTVIVLESTPNEHGDLFHQSWIDAVEGRSQYVPLFTSWLDIEEWRREVPLELDGAFRVYVEEGRRIGDDPYEHVDIVHPACRVAMSMLGLTPRERVLVLRHGADFGQILWRRMVLSSPDFRGDEVAFEREYPTSQDDCFIQAGGSVFPVDAVMEYLGHVREPDKGVFVFDSRFRNGVAFRPNPFGNVWIYEHPVEGEEYVIGVDPALGRGVDWNAAVVIKRSDESVVAEVRDQTMAIEFADTVDRLRRYYGKEGDVAPVICEGQIGVAVIMQLEQLDPRGLYYEAQGRGSKRSVAMRRLPGLWMTDVKKRLLISYGIEALHHGECDIPSERLLREMLSFVRNERGTAEARRSEHDDLVMAWLMALYYNRYLPTAAPPPTEKSVYRGRCLLSRMVWDDIMHEREVAASRSEPSSLLQATLGRMMGEYGRIHK